MEEWEVEFTDEFGAWWEGLSEAEHVDVRAEVNLLRRFGPTLGRPHVDSVASSKHANMRNCVFSTEDGLTACCLPLTRGALRFC